MFAENCYIVFDETTREAMIVDPGMVTESERKVIDDFIAKEKLTLKYLVNTHLHLDHCFGNAYIINKYGIHTLANIADAPLGNDITAQAHMFGLAGRFESVGEITPLNQGDILTLGQEQIRVIATPGHSPGGISLYAPADGWVITGDTLFGDGNIGRTDLPGGDYHTLINSVKRLQQLPPATKLLPGHGNVSTIAATQTF